MNSSLSSVDSLSIYSDERDIVKAAYDYLVDWQYLENCSKNHKRTIRRKASRFEVADGELYLKKKKKKYQKVNTV